MAHRGATCARPDRDADRSGQARGCGRHGTFDQAILPVAVRARRPWSFSSTNTESASRRAEPWNVSTWAAKATSTVVTLLAKRSSSDCQAGRAIAAPRSPPMCCRCPAHRRGARPMQSLRTPRTSSSLTGSRCVRRFQRAATSPNPWAWSDSCARHDVSPLVAQHEPARRPQTAAGDRPVVGRARRDTIERRLPHEVAVDDLPRHARTQGGAGDVVQHGSSVRVELIETSKRQIHRLSRPDDDLEHLADGVTVPADQRATQANPVGAGVAGDHHQATIDDKRHRTARRNERIHRRRLRRRRVNSLGHELRSFAIGTSLRHEPARPQVHRQPHQRVMHGTRRHRIGPALPLEVFVHRVVWATPTVLLS